jgi:hypothetical protein
MSDREIAEQALRVAGFIQSLRDTHVWVKDRADLKDEDKVLVYKSWGEPGEGTFKATISGDLKDLPALLADCVTLLAENARLRKAFEDVAHMEFRDGLDEDIPDDKEAAYRKGYEDAAVDAFAIADEALKEVPPSLSNETTPPSQG